MRPRITQYRSPLELKMTPMIDVVFLLLVFFLWTSSFEEPEFDMPGALAATATSTKPAKEEKQPETELFDEMVIRVIGSDAKTIRYTLNDRSIPTLRSLREQLQAISALGIQPLVVVDPEETTPIDQVIRVYDIAQGAGLERVLFAAKQ